MKNTSIILSAMVLILILGVFTFTFCQNSTKEKKVATINLPLSLPNECTELKNFPANSKEISKIKKGKNSYFPDKIFGEGSEDDEAFKHDWYGEHLKAANEKSLLDISDKDSELYRFTWLRTFNHPVIVRIEKQKDKLKIFFKRLDGMGGYEPGKISTEKEISINKKDWCKFIRLLNDTDYWQMPTQKTDENGNDGSQWIIEGVKENRYHVVDRWSPKEGKYRELGLLMLKLSGFDLDKNKDDLY